VQNKIMDKRVLAKILGMLVLLVFVVYTIKFIKSDEFVQNAESSDSALSILIGSQAHPVNWCPRQVTKLEVFDDDGHVTQTLTTYPETVRVCEVMMGSVAKDALDSTEFVQRAIATGAKGEQKILEQGKKGSPIFRLQGMPFTSAMLEKALKH
jgi:hypothetical protein